MRNYKLDQSRAPLAAALEEFRRNRVVPFDVPGHKRGRGNPELLDFLGERCLSVDVNSMKPLDNLCHPVSVIKEAEELAADAFGAAHAYFMVGGTTSAVQAMVLACAHEGEKIILPRNVHRSAINALILSGAVPVYVDPSADNRLGISLGMEAAAYTRAIEENPDAKAILVNNPTYYGVCSDIRGITALAHSKGMAVLADEAHGTHLYFGSGLPVDAMAAGADLAAVSMHKSGGSLTQSSLLLAAASMEDGWLRQIINLTQTTSASYLLMVSLDISRRRLAQGGEAIFSEVTELADYARSEINRIGDYYAFSREIVNGGSIYDFDVTKLVINTLGVGLSGAEVYDRLRDEYDIQAEFGDLSNVLCYISVGDRRRDVERLIGSLSEIRRLYKKPPVGLASTEYLAPRVAAAPKTAFYAPKREVKLAEAAGEVSGEFVMCYPPGIPILAPGETVTAEIIDYIARSKAKGCSLTGPADLSCEKLRVLA